MKIALSKIKPSPDNATGRSEINEAMEELIATIKAVGVCEGISVRPNGKEYEIIGGERRWFAAKKAGIKEVDAIVHDVDEAQARLMRLASLSHSDWEYEEFAKAIWRELIERPEASLTDLSNATGLSRNKIKDAADFAAATEYDAVVRFDGEIKAAATSEIWSRFNPKKEKRYQTLVKQITNKCSDEKIGYNMEVRKLCNRVKKALPNTVVFGNPEEDDYEEHNFELDAVLRIEWGIKDYETEVKYIAEGTEEEERKRWEAARFDEKAMKKFTDALLAWKRALKEVNRTKSKFSPEAAQFCANELEGISKIEDEILEYFNQRSP